MCKKLSYEYVYNYFKQNGCELLETEYINAKIKMRYICKCGNEKLINWNHFQQGKRCKICAIKNLKNIKSLSYEYVYKYFKQNGCELLETEYINTNIKMRYICKCGNFSSIKFNHFKNGIRCRSCGCSKSSISKKKNIDKIKLYIKSFNYELISTKYIDAKHKLEIKCEQNHIFKMSWNGFQQGKRCKLCFYENNIGENHSSWNPNREEIKLNQRIRIKHNKNWIKNNLNQDPLYIEYLKEPEKYHIDHIIPISAFCKILVEQKLDEKRIKKIANEKENIQILPITENLIKHSKYDDMLLLEYIKKYY